MNNLLAGCSSSDGEDPTSADPPGEKSSYQVAPPTVDLPEGWELTTPNTESHVFLEDSWTVIDYRAIGHTRRFENIALRNRVKEDVFDNFDRPLVVGSATHLQLDVFGGGITERVVLRATSRIEEKAKAEFRKRMNEFGVSNLTSEGTYEPNGSRSPSNFSEFSGTFTVEAVEITGVDIPNIDKESFTLESGELDIVGLLGVHRQDGNIFITGGAFPGENYFRNKTWDITGSVSLDLAVDLGLRSHLYRRQIVDLARSVRT